jgi:CelD/BcsL family acetyltransferase involved in cellulose biosynthesis
MPPAAGPLQIESIRDAAGFHALRAEWDALLARSPADTPFLTWEWLYTWWRCFGEAHRLRLLTVRASGRLVAAAPLFARGWDPRRLRFFRRLSWLGAPHPRGNVGSDYLDVLIEREAGAAADALAGALGAEARVLDLPQVLATHSATDGLVRRLGGVGWSAIRTEAGVCPFVDLAGHTWASYLASLGAEHRYAVQRKLRRIHRDFDATFAPARTEDERREALDQAIALHELRFREKGASDAFHTAALRRFHEEFTRLALARGWLRLHLLRLGGRPAAALYGLRYGRSFFFYQSGFDPAYARYGVGVVTMALSIEAAIAEGAEEYDLLHGDEEYKFHWANAVRPLVRWELFPPRLNGAIARAFSRAYAAARPMARRVLPRERHEVCRAGAGIGAGETT